MAPEQETRLEDWKKALIEAKRVVHYDPDTEEGFFYVPLREDVDNDLIRLPDAHL